MLMPLTRTPAEVAARTGIAGVTVANIATAVGIVSAVVGYDLAAVTLPAFRPRDLDRMTAAVDWQAVYVQQNPGVTTQAGNLTSASANGVAVGYDASGSAGALLAPLARLSLDRLSWRRSRSISMKRVPDRPVAPPQSLISDGADTDWTRLR
jgi:hypothetical protein